MYHKKNNMHHITPCILMLVYFLANGCNVASEPTHPVAPRVHTQKIEKLDQKIEKLKNNPLYQAYKNNNLAEFKALIQGGAHVNQICESKHSKLFSNYFIQRPLAISILGSYKNENKLPFLAALLEAESFDVNCYSTVKLPGKLVRTILPSCLLEQPYGVILTLNNLLRSHAQKHKIDLSEETRLQQLLLDKGYLPDKIHKQASLAAKNLEVLYPTLCSLHSD